MIPFYIMSAVVVIVLVFWQYREHEHSKQLMELTKLIKSHDLADYAASKQDRPQTPATRNFVRASIERAYTEKYGDLDG